MCNFSYCSNISPRTRSDRTQSKLSNFSSWYKSSFDMPAIGCIQKWTVPWLWKNRVSMSADLYTACCLQLGRARRWWRGLWWGKGIIPSLWLMKDLRSGAVFLCDFPTDVAYSVPGHWQLGRQAVQTVHCFGIWVTVWQDCCTCDIAGRHTSGED